MDIIFLSQGNFYLLNSLVVNDPPLERAMLKQVNLSFCFFVILLLLLLLIYLVTLLIQTKIFF